MIRPTTLPDFPPESATTARPAPLLAGAFNSQEDHSQNRLPRELKHSPEYFAGLLQNCEEELERIGELYSAMREALVEEEAWKLHGACCAGASPKSIGQCREITSYKLNVPCVGCNGLGQVGNPASQTQDASIEECQFCKGEGRVSLPHIEWMRGGKVYFAIPFLKIGRVVMLDPSRVDASLAKFEQTEVTR